MKRLAQFGVLLVAAILAAQPVLAELSCTARRATSCVPNCPMSAMAGDCPMEHSQAINRCPGNCCTRVVPQAIIQPAAPERLRPVALMASGLPALYAFAPRSMASAAHAHASGLSASPPLYLLNRVFRI